MALLPSFSPPDVLPMKHSSSATGSFASSISSTIASSSLTPAGLALSSSIDVDDYPHGPVVKVILYHPSLLKIEADFPNVIPVQEIPCNCFFVEIHDGPQGNKVDGLFRLRRFEQNDKLNSWPGPQNKTRQQQDKQQSETSEVRCTRLLST